MINKPMRVKLLMQWDIRQEAESEYFEFIVSEFIPKLNYLGFEDLNFWYTAYAEGDCEQILASGLTSSPEKMQSILSSEKWFAASDRLLELVDNYEQKLIKGTGGFQL